MSKLLTIQDKELNSLFQRILPPEDFGEDSNVEELYNRIMDMETENRKLKEGIKKYVHHWHRYFGSPKVGQPPMIKDLESLFVNN